MTSVHTAPFYVASFPGFLSLSGGIPPKMFEFPIPIEHLIICWRQTRAVLDTGML